MPEEPLETRTQIAQRLGIKLSTLSSTLSIMRFKPTQIDVENGNAIHKYNPAKVAEIEAIFKKEKP